ncbi:uncharacterized protein LOC101900749 [Musca domestica]|uniref:Uncharacterized protein LOC101900749 n=1 Tax=Musca domestica TaxID=7370 RepID=A0A1I8NEK2_MUSDO|nr:uncharacterized protein LOC101900749 [Musca domestica]
MDFLEKYSTFELFIASGLMPVVFVFLWYLIIGDFKNFKGSKVSCSEFTATDPVNCYQNYKKSK